MFQVSSKFVNSMEDIILAKAYKSHKGHFIIGTQTHRNRNNFASHCCHKHKCWVSSYCLENLWALKLRTRIFSDISDISDIFERRDDVTSLGSNTGWRM